MLETKRRPPRAPEDHRMNLYHDTFRGRLRWYVKVSKTGRRIDITEEYSTDERSDFHQAWEAAVRALGGVPRMRRVKPDEAPATTRRYLISDVSEGSAALVCAAARQVAEDQNLRAVRQRAVQSCSRCCDRRPDRKIRRRDRLGPRREADARKARATANYAASP